jgi:hypothetical protein
MRFNRKSAYVTVSNDALPISLQSMKQHLRVDGTQDDDIITAYINTAVEAIKQYTRRAIKTETFVFKADGFADANGDDRLLQLGPGVHTGSRPYLLGGGETLDLPFPPLQSVTSVVTYDRGNNALTFSASLYRADLQSGRIYLNEGETWPSNLRAQDAVEVTYIAGYGSANVPAPILQAIRLHVEGMYDGTCMGLSADIMGLLAPYRLGSELPW